MTTGKRIFAPQIAALLLMAGLLMLLGTACSSVSATEQWVADLEVIRAQLPDIPDDLDEKIKSVIYREDDFGTERVISVGAQDEALYPPADWQAILTAVEMGLVHWDETVSEPKLSPITLDENAIVASLEHLDRIVVTTPHTRLCVTAPNGDFVGELTLYDAADTTPPLQTLTFNGETTPFYFTDLTADTTYLIAPSHTEGAALLRITAE